MTVQHALNDEDPERLRRFGPLADEYAHEARLIAERVGALPSGQRTVERVTDIIAEVWLRMFGEVSGDVRLRRPVFERVAKRILTHESARVWTTPAMPPHQDSLPAVR